MSRRKNGGGFIVMKITVKQNFNSCSLGFSDMRLFLLPILFYVTEFYSSALFDAVVQWLYFLVSYSSNGSLINHT